MQMTLELNNPLTEEEWDMLTDVDMDNTPAVTFHTKHGKDVEYVKVVRCKDCKNWDTTWQNDYAPLYHYCPMIDGTRRNDFYCADAERRSDETD